MTDRVDEVALARSRRTRTETALERDRTAFARSDASRLRDEDAERRDREAEARDIAADARDAEFDRLDRTEAILEKAQAARRAGALDRARAREDRMRAAADRRQAALELANEGIDHLTGALRRHVGLAAIERELDRASRTGEPLVVAFVDVDGLKAVNDTRGHKAGDELLRGVVAGIQAGLRPYDLVVRYGGDEFICSLSGQGLAGIRARFDRIAASIAASNSGAGISVGLAEATAGATVDALIVEADQTMLSVRRQR